MDNIVTPVKAEILEERLTAANYRQGKKDFVVRGFKEGFELQFEGNRRVRRTSNNLKIQPGVGSETEMWNKVMKEVQAKRYAGPFRDPPFEFFIQSPISLVPKDKGKKTRLIFHLSHPRRDRNGKVATTSVNAGILKKSVLCTIQILKRQ